MKSSLQPVANAPEPALLTMTDKERSELQEQLKNSYTTNNAIRGLFGRPFPLEGQYIHVQMIYDSQIQAAEKKEEEKKQTPTRRNPVRLHADGCCQRQNDSLIATVISTNANQ
jgi:hypothetical protein